MQVKTLTLCLLLAGCTADTSTLSNRSSDTALATGPATSTPASTPGKTEISANEAAKLAEDFIALNGYTDLPGDKDNLTRESVEWSSNSEEELRLRHNSLEKSAFGVKRGRKGGEPGWTVVFRYKSNLKATDEAGRAVTMSPTGTDIRVEHLDFFLKFVSNTVVNSNSSNQ